MAPDADSQPLDTLGALRGDDGRAFEAHLAACDVCRTEVDAFAAVAAELGRASQPHTPNDTLRARVLDRFAAENAFATQAMVDLDGVRFIRAKHLDWEPGSAPGIEIKTLAVDTERGAITRLVRMPPGSSLRAHRHAAVEESYVLDGDLLVSGVLMHTGDYCRAEPGSVHRDMSTRSGCLFIAVGSLHDERLA